MSVVITSVLSENDPTTEMAVLVAETTFPKLATTPVKLFARSFASPSQEPLAKPEAPVENPLFY